MHHGAGLRRTLTEAGMECDARDRLVESFKKDWRTADLAAADRAMLEYAIKLTRAPWEIKAADVRSLGEAGFDDRAIHDICAIAAYYAFVNRIADGLGVEVE